MNPNDPLYQWMQQPCSSDFFGQVLGTLAILAVAASIFWGTVKVLGLSLLKILGMLVVLSVLGGCAITVVYVNHLVHIHR